MFDIRRQFFPYIDIDSFKKIIKNLHHKLRKKGIEISVSEFKDKIVNFDSEEIGFSFKDFSRFCEAVKSSKKEKYNTSINKYPYISNGGYLLYGMPEIIAELLGIRKDLVYTELDRQIVRFSKKEPFLVFEGKVFTKKDFSKILKMIKETEALILVCMANDEEDALACYNQLYCEESPTIWNTIFIEEGQIDNSFYAHLLPAGTLSDTFNEPPVSELAQLRRPDIALHYWAEVNKDEYLKELLEFARTDKRFRYRVYFDEYTANVRLLDFIIKARRSYTVEFINPRRSGYSPLPPLMKEEDIRINSDDDFTVKYVDNIIKYTKLLQKRYEIKYKNQEKSVYIISNKVLYLEEKDPDIVIPLDNAIIYAQSFDAAMLICKQFGIAGYIVMDQILRIREMIANKNKRYN